jgi:hypothetical protein
MFLRVFVSSHVLSLKSGKSVKAPFPFTGYKAVNLEAILPKEDGVVASAVVLLGC